jgi:hypothetical protein
MVIDSSLRRGSPHWHKAKADRRDAERRSDIDKSAGRSAEKSGLGRNSDPRHLPMIRSELALLLYFYPHGSLFFSPLLPIYPIARKGISWTLIAIILAF